MATHIDCASTPIDYDLHGIVGIRLLNAAPGDAAAVTRQLGPIQAPLTCEPDIIIRFVDQLAVSSPVHYLGVDEVGFTDDAFLVLRSKHKAQAKVQVRMEQVGEQCEIVCETGLPAVPLLVPILNLAALAKGAMPLHASAFTYNGTGVLATGWSKGGKTETLLAFMARGAEYIGDEWVYISGDGQHMYGIPEPIRVWDWHLHYLPQYRARVGSGDRIRLRVIKLAQALERAVSEGPGRRLFFARAMKRVRPVLKRQLHVDISPQRLFGRGRCSLAGSPQKVLFMTNHGAPEMTIRPINPREIAQRMVFSLQYERLPFTSYYLAFRFAFPETRNEFIERAEELQRERLIEVLADKEAYAVHHPYPVPIPTLFDIINPIL